MPEFPILLVIRTDREFRLICERIEQLESKPPSPIRTIELRRLRAAALHYMRRAPEQHQTANAARVSAPVPEGRTRQTTRT